LTRVNVALVLRQSFGGLSPFIGFGEPSGGFIRSSSFLEAGSSSKVSFDSLNQSFPVLTKTAKSWRRTTKVHLLLHGEGQWLQLTCLHERKLGHVFSYLKPSLCISEIRRR